MGLVQEVVPRGKALERALEIAAALCTYPQPAMRNDRRAALEGADDADRGGAGATRWRLTARREGPGDGGMAGAIREG